MGSAHQTQKNLKTLAKKYGARLVTEGRKSHPRLLLPNGRFVICSCSTDDWRAIKNVERDIRRELREHP